MTPRRRRPDETTEEYSAAMQKFKELEQRFYGGRREAIRTNLDAPQTGRSAAQINAPPIGGLAGLGGGGGWLSNFFGFNRPSAIPFSTSRKTNTPVEVAGLGNVVSDPDGSMYGQSASPAIADYMAPQEQGQTLKEEEVFNPNQQFLGGIREGEDSPWSPGAIRLNELISEQRKEQGPISAEKLNQNIPGNIYAKHGGSVFRNAYDQASNIMYRAGGGGLEGLRESIDINGQPHNLAYINPSEANLLKVLGGSGKEVNGIPAFQDIGDLGNYDYGIDESDYPDDPGGGNGGGGNGVKGGRGSPKHAEQPGERADQAALDAPPGDPYGFWVEGGPNPPWPNQPDARSESELNKFLRRVWGKDIVREKLDKTDRERAAQVAHYKTIGEKMSGPRGPTGQYANMVTGLSKDATDEEIGAALRNAQLSWWATEQHYGSDKTEEEKMKLAGLYSQEEYRTDAEFAMKVGKSPLNFETMQNKAKEAKEQKTEDIRESLKEDYDRNPDEYGKEPMDLDTIMDRNEEYVEQEQRDAVINSMLGQEGVENFIAHDPSKGVFQLGPGVMETIWDIVTGDKTFNIEEAPQAILSTIMSQAGWSAVDAAAWVANFVGDIMGEKVIGTVDVNNITMNLHESGKLTFGSPEDDPGYDPSSVEGGDDSGLISLKEERLPVKVEVEEEEDKGIRSIADLVPKRDSSEEVRDYGLELYQSIYGSDENPFV